MYALTVLSVVLYAVHVTCQGSPCVCTTHVQTQLHASPIHNSTPVGFLYQDECKLHYPNFDKPGFFAILHFHQIAYIYADSGVIVGNCTNLMLDTSDKLTTAHSTTSTSSVTGLKTASSVTGSQTLTRVAGSTTGRVVASHTPSSVTGPTATTIPTTFFKAAHCNKLAVFIDLAKGINVGLLNSVKCPDNMHHDADLLVSAFCGAPDSLQWIRGPHVISHCNSLAKYIPVAVFDNSTTYKQTAGILLGCNQHSIQLVTQNCSTGLHISEISTQDAPSARDVYVIEW